MMIDRQTSIKLAHFVDYMVYEHDWSKGDIVSFLHRPDRWKKEMQEFEDTGKVTDEEDNTDTE
tara:strand:+ start:779 stop:967 length:189 start_codon:yes stop_codon:yes gene_type:complete